MIGISSNARENVVEDANTVYENTSSSGVGSKVDLKFDPETLRIEDLEEDEEDFDTLQTKTLVADYKEVAAIRTEDKDDTVSV